MIRELKSAGHNFLDKEQLQDVIKFLPARWKYMKIHMTHNESIKSFEDIDHLLVLKDERHDTFKANDESAGTSNPKQKNKNKKARKKKGSDKSN